MNLYKIAEDDFKKALQLNPRNYKAQFFKGYTLEMQNNEFQAMIEYDKATLLNPNFDQAHYRKGLMKHHSKNYRGAFEDYEKAIAINPKYANALLNRGYVAEYFKTPREVIKLIPGLENATILRYGVMHRNTYINSPKLLNSFYQLKKDERMRTNMERGELKGKYILK